MRKIFLSFILVLALKGYGQTYTLNLHVYVTKGVASVNSNVGGNIYTFSNTNNYGSQDYPNLTTVKGNSFTFNLSTNTGACSQNLSVTKSLLELLRDNFTLQSCPTGSGYAGNFYPNSFVPNGITINNRNSTAEVCSGEQLELDANSTNIFPNEVYHWQYSLDNKTYWYDVPATKNNSPSTKFSINDFLGDNIHNYFDKVIYFRLGYGQSKQFTTPLGITFRPCTPIITNIIYENPKCQGDPISKLDIVFERKLDNTKEEKLASIFICDVNDNSKIFMQINDPVSYPDDTKMYIYTTFQSLETGHYYKIRYQAQITDPDDSSKTIMRGIMDSPATLNFLYTDPAKMEFKITNQTQPSCFGGNDGAIEIQILSGQSPFHFYKDDVELTGASQPTLNTGKYYITGLQEKTYNIMVTDSKNCIDKTAND
ncbi:hypothetical protein [Flavobacterium aquariorum]|nr:hypothetical protein [Flavobacterium aquariorum]